MKRIAFSLVAAAIAWGGAARADDAAAPSPPPSSPASPSPVPTSRLALVPFVGAGFAHVSKSDVFPSNVGTTSLGVEIDGAVGDFGGLVRGQFLSSGQAGRWTALSYALGGSYRVFGDGFRALALVVRAGVAYEHWRASTGGCDVMLFVPNNCKDFTPPPGSGVVNTAPPSVHLGFDAVGVFGGVRIELPVRAFYLAIDAEVAPAVELGDASGMLLQLRTALVFGLRHRRAKSGGIVDPTFTPRPGRGGTL